MKTAIFSVVALLFISGASYSGPGIDPCGSSVSLTGCSWMQLNICPAGDFDSIRDQCGSDGYISVTVLDREWEGIPGIPWTDYWIGSCDPGNEIMICMDGVVADSLTNQDGETTISGAIAGSGCAVSGGVYLKIQNIIIMEQPACTEPACIAIEIRSPDYVPDGMVDLSDLSAFSSSFGHCWGEEGYIECFDFHNDDCINLSDFAKFACHWRHRCY
ncbi:MAG: hypothetical protein GF417_10075 [Candidatus Latescibacteria bacterium]|nr:hypothetical protein [bacterium]MBD3424773.1 hypothetical protein [Candidatus Latescibacterota bacterium]